MNNKMFGAIACVVIIVVAGVAVYLTFNEGGDSPNYGLSDNIDGRLTIFGNANEDDYIDQRDVETVQAIIAGEIEPTYFDCYITYGGNTVQRCLADANCDGKIDQVDVDWIQDMVDRKQNMQVYYYDVDGVCASCTYPLTTLAVGYKSNYEAVLICGAEDRVLYACNQVADSSSSYYKWYHEYFADAQNIGSRFTPDYEVFVQGSNSPPSAFITGTRAWFDSDMEETIAPLGVDVVRLPFWEDNVTVSGVITLGYLLGCEDEAYEYAEMSDSVLQTIQDAVADIPLEERPLVFASYNGSSISTLHNGVHEFVTAAGGRTVIDEGYSNGSIDGEGILVMDPDWICFSLYYGFLETYDTLESTKATMYNALVSTDNKYFQIIEGTDAYKEGNVLIFSQGMFMGPLSYITIGYLANHIYPDLFDFDCDELFAEYLAKYHPDWTIEDFEDLQYYEMQTVLDYFA